MVFSSRLLYFNHILKVKTEKTNLKNSNHRFYIESEACYSMLVRQLMKLPCDELPSHACTDNHLTILIESLHI